MFNGTYVEGNHLLCHEIASISDFRVTVGDKNRHFFDQDYDGIGYENNDN